MKLITFDVILACLYVLQSELILRLEVHYQFEILRAKLGGTNIKILQRLVPFERPDKRLHLQRIITQVIVLHKQLFKHWILIQKRNNVWNGIECHLAPTDVYVAHL